MNARFLILAMLTATFLVVRVAAGEPPALKTSSRVEKKSEVFAADSTSQVREPAGMTHLNASVSIEVAGLKSVAPGVSMTTELIVRNNGPVAVSRVHVELELPQGTKLVFAWPAPEGSADRLSWNLGSLDIDGERRLKLELQPGTINELELSPMISYMPAVGMKTTFRQATLVVTQTMPSTLVRGGTAELIVQAENKGKEPLGRVTLVDYLPAGLKQAQGQTVQEELGTLAPGQVREVRLKVTAAISGRWSNTVFVYAEGGLSGQSRATIQVLDPTLALKLATVESSSLTGGAMELNVEAKNPGSSEATGTRIVVVLPEGLDYLSASTAGTYDAETRSVRWSPGAIAAGAVWSGNVTVQPRRNGDWPCQARLNSDQHSEVHAQQIILVRRAAGLTLEVLNHPQSLESGAEEIVEFVLLNESAVASTNVRLIARTTASLGFLKVHGPTTAAVDRDVVRFEPIAEVPSHGRAVYRLRVRGLQPGQGSIQLEIVSDQQQVERQQIEMAVTKNLVP